ncbi:hypothetical protein BS50DRAFT_572489 [Corynespora cassiicola Philippines]|uniref:Uncharacterized protein n=1 Tax=Corynespora cassiicola Philippines TaxID=1448308 RepID=A0A2T2NVC2_CORCC|nr:hypothetical protein BS50DRAFT_572489 [Corynespora cassiicola Philippines]
MIIPIKIFNPSSSHTSHTASPDTHTTTSEPPSHATATPPATGAKPLTPVPTVCDTTVAHPTTRLSDPPTANTGTLSKKKYHPTTNLWIPCEASRYNIAVGTSCTQGAVRAGKR